MLPKELELPVLCFIGAFVFVFVVACVEAAIASFGKRRKK